MIKSNRSITGNSSLFDPVVAAINDANDDDGVDRYSDRSGGGGSVNGVAGSGRKAKTKPDLRRIFTSPVFYSICIVSICSCFAFYVLLTFLPQYMEYEMGVNLKKSGFLSVMPFVMQIVSLKHHYDSSL